MPNIRTHFTLSQTKNKCLHYHLENTLTLLLYYHSLTHAQFVIYLKLWHLFNIAQSQFIPHTTFHLFSRSSFFVYCFTHGATLLLILSTLNLFYFKGHINFQTILTSIIGEHQISDSRKCFLIQKVLIISRVHSNGSIFQWPTYTTVNHD